MSKKDADDIKETIENDSPVEEAFKVTRKNLLSTGSTLLNLACSGNPYGGFLKGKYYFIVGDSASGKTFLSLSCFTEAVHSKSFKDYRLIYDNIEDGCLIDVDKLFGEDVADRIEAPAITKDGEPIYSETIEEFYYNMDDIISEGKPFIYVLDSMDGLTSDSELKKFDEQKIAHRKSKDITGTYGDGKAKSNSQGLRKVLNGLRDTGSILLVLGQTRDNIGFGFNPQSVSGGRALRFYATVEFWSKIKGQITKTIKKKKRQIGTRIIIKFKKNRITGKLHEVETDIYPSYGIDDIGSCIDYLISEQVWRVTEKADKKDKKKKSGKQIKAPEFDFVGSREKFIKHIEGNNLEDKLRSMVGRCWKEIEDACSLKRKKKYSEEE